MVGRQGGIKKERIFLFIYFFLLLRETLAGCHGRAKRGKRREYFPWREGGKVWGQAVVKVKQHFWPPHANASFSLRREGVETTMSSVRLSRDDWTMQSF